MGVNFPPLVVLQYGYYGGFQKAPRRMNRMSDFLKSDTSAVGPVM